MKTSEQLPPENILVEVEGRNGFRINMRRVGAEWFYPDGIKVDYVPQYWHELDSGGWHEKQSYPPTYPYLLL